MTEPVRYPSHQVLVNGGTADATDQVDRTPGPLGTRFVDMSNTVRRIRTTKAIGHPNGQFELSLTFRSLEELGRSALCQVLVPDNALVISLNRGLPGDQLEDDMIGFVTHIGERTTLSARGQPQREVVVRGEDAGKFLVRHELPAHLFSAFVWGDQETQQRARAGLAIGAVPVGQVLRRIYDNVFAKLLDGQGGVADGQGVALVIHPDLEDPAHGVLSDQAGLSLWTAQGKWWHLFQAYADQPWTELRTDYQDGFRIFARPHPFDRAAWDALPTTTLADDELRLEDLARGDDERVNLVVVPLVGAGALVETYYEAMQLQTLQFNRESARRHGAQMLLARTRYAVGGATTDATALTDAARGQGDLIHGLQARAKQLWRWHSPNHLFWKGTLVVAGNPRLRIGERVANQAAPSDFFVDSEYERRVYYVERVVQDYVDGQHYFAHLGVTRGQPLGRFLEALPVDPPPAGLGGTMTVEGGTETTTSTTTSGLVQTTPTTTQDDPTTTPTTFSGGVATTPTTGHPPKIRIPRPR